MKNKILLLVLIISIGLMSVAAVSAATITSCGTVTEDSILGADLTSSGTCLKVTVNGITLEGNGHTITGISPSPSNKIVGVDLSARSGVTVKNLNIESFFWGILLDSSSNNILTGNSLRGNTNIGIFMLSASNSNTLTNNNVSQNSHGIYLDNSDDTTITDNIVNSNSANGITLVSSDSNILTNNIVNLNNRTNPTNSDVANGIHMRGSDFNVLTNNIFSENSVGIHLVGDSVRGSSDFNKFISNTANSNNIGIFIGSGGHDNLLTDNTANSNFNRGIYFLRAHRNNLTRNIARFHSGANREGIRLHASTGNILRENIVSNNNAGIRLIVSNSNTIIKNTAHSSGTGISLNGDFNTVTDNNVSNRNNVGIQLGLANNNIISGNIANSNFNSGIFLSFLSNSNILTSNVVNSNGRRGIYLKDSSSNTFTSNTVNFNNEYGIYFDTPQQSSGNNVNTFTDNVLNGNTISGFRFIGATNYYNTIKDNTVNGDTYYHLVNENGVVLENIVSTASNPSNLGWVSVINSTGITLNNLELANNNAGSGIFVFQTTDSNIIENDISNNRNGVVLTGGSLGNTVHYNNLFSNTANNGVDNTVGNTWDDGVCAGNYWGTSTPTTPFPIAGIGRAFDNYPLSSSWPGIHDQNNNGIADCGEPDACGSLKIEANIHTVGSGSHPGSTKEPLVGVEFGVYDKSSTGTSCSDGQSLATACGSPSHNNYDCIVDMCDPVTTGTTDGNGIAIIPLLAGDYVIITTDNETTKTSLADRLGVSASDFQCSIDNNPDTITMRKHLQQINKADGKKVPAKTKKVKGSELLIIEPEYIEWTTLTELYPILFETSEDWTTATAISPPEGYVSDFDSLTEIVTNEVEAVQFTITEVGSVPGDTFVVHRVKGPNGKTVVIKSGIPAKLTPAWENAKGKGKGITGFATADGTGSGSLAVVITALTLATLIGVVLLLRRK